MPRTWRPAATSPALASAWEDAKVLGILDAPGTRRPPPPAQPRGSRAAQPARCGLAAGSHPSPHKALRGKRLGFTFFFFFNFKDWGKILGSEYTHRLIRLCSEEENKRSKGACSTREPVNCLPVAPLSSAIPPSVLQASIPHILSQSIAREPQHRRT